ncbi:MAG: hypothetical protein ACFFCM_10040 [Promethearchaeota archaeon]
MKKNKMFGLLIVQMFIVSAFFLVSSLPNSFNLLLVSNTNQYSAISKDNIAITLWQDNGTFIDNNESSDVQDIQVCCDGAGGAIFVWEDNRDDTGDIYAQKINANGNPVWGSGGIVVCNETNLQYYSTICCDGAGGVIIVWQDGRNTDDDIYAQRINANGNPVWANNGIVICNASGDQYLNELNTRICCYSSYFIITWEDQRDGNDDIYAQKLDLSGNTYWGNGTVGDKNGAIICNTDDDSNNPAICCDGVGGAIITWYEDRSLGTDDDIYAQRIDSNGNTFWGDGTPNDKNGTSICNISGDQNNPVLCSVKNLGAIIVWEDDRPGLLGEGIFAQRIDMSGNIYWGNGTVGDKNGTMLRNYPGISSEIKICCFGDRSVIVVWEDNREDNGIYAQRVDFNGIIFWGNGSIGDKNGTAICNATNSQEYPSVCCYDSKYAIISWNDNRNNITDHDIYAQKIDLSGNLYWGNGTTGDKNGSIICNSINDNDYPVICCDGSGGAIIGWYDLRRTILNYDLYAQRIKGIEEEHDYGLLLLLFQEPTNIGLTIGLIIILIAIGAGILFLYLRER